MSDKNRKKTSEEQLNLETNEKTAQIEQEIDENKEKIKNYKKQAARSFVLAFSTLIAIIAICIAWFVSNNTVTMTGTSISAEDSVPFELGSAGVRQTSEEEKLGDFLSVGTLTPFTDYINIDFANKKSSKVSNADLNIYTGSSGLAWYLESQESFFPGVSGELEFYIIPKQEGLKKATIKLSLEGYAENGSNAEKKNDDTLQNLIQGHILIFGAVDDKIGYSGWVAPNEPLTINAETFGLENNTFQKNVAYKITFHWIWPRYFRNYIYTKRSSQNDLFTDATPTGDGTDYNKLLNFVNAQRPNSADSNVSDSTQKSKLFYSADGSLETDPNMKEKIHNKMADAVYESCNKYYNLADEYIGNNADYIYVKVEVEP